MILPGLVNLSLGASCTDSNGSGTYSGSVASITSPGGTWCPSTSPGVALVDLGTTSLMPLCSAELNAGDQRNDPVNWFLEWATSTGGPWTQVVSYNLAYATVDFNFTPVVARYWRLRPDPATTSGHMNLNWIAVYGVRSAVLA